MLSNLFVFQNQSLHILLHYRKYAILVSIVVSIPACHAGDQGSIP